MPINPRLIALLAAGARTNQTDTGLAGENTTEPTLDDFALSHLSGYGQVDAPSPWGYNRDVFDQEHPNYQGGYYNPATGFYDAPQEVAFAGPQGPSGPETGASPGGFDWTGALGGNAPDPGAASPGPGAEQSYGTGVPQDSGRGDNTQEQSQQGSQDPGTNFDMGSFLSALAAMGEFDQSQGAGDHDSSNTQGGY